MKIALISDLHANIHALNAVIRDLDIEKPDKILVAGDIVGYYYWPREVVELLMHDDRFICIGGNHENILREVLENNESAKIYRKKYGSGYECCRQQLTDKQIDWLLELPKELQVSVGQLDFRLAHGTLEDADEYLYPDAAIERLLACYSGSDFTVFGHTHYPFLHTWDGRYLLNPGSVGQPRDVGGSASYVMVNEANRVVRFKRMTFDVRPVIEAAQRHDSELFYLADIMNRRIE